VFSQVHCFINQYEFSAGWQHRSGVEAPGLLFWLLSFGPVRSLNACQEKRGVRQFGRFRVLKFPGGVLFIKQSFDYLYGQLCRCVLSRIINFLFE